MPVPDPPSTAILLNGEQSRFTDALVLTWTPGANFDPLLDTFEVMFEFAGVSYSLPNVAPGHYFGGLLPNRTYRVSVRTNRGGVFSAPSMQHHSTRLPIPPGPGVIPVSPSGNLVTWDLSAVAFDNQAETTVKLFREENGVSTALSGGSPIQSGTIVSEEIAVVGYYLVLSCPKADVAGGVSLSDRGPSTGGIPVGSAMNVDQSRSSRQHSLALLRRYYAI